MIKKQLHKFLTQNKFKFHRIFIFLIIFLLMTNFFIFKVNVTDENADFEILNGMNLTQLTQYLENQKLISSAWRLKMLFYISGNQNQIKKGNYRIKQGSSSLDLLRMITQGKETTHAITFVEGTTLYDALEIIKNNKNIKQTLPANINETELLKILEAEEPYLEGLIYPDTYYFVKNTSDVDLLKKSYQTLKRKLKLAWQHRADNLPYKNEYEALIMASIIEKEVTYYDEAPEVAGVFVNRLNKGMRLQTDPTVIYGMKDSFDGNIRKKDLMQDNPYNTYTRFGLPPSPISLVSYKSINAALNPANTNFLYFVAMGNSRHYFSQTLDEHNDAVNKYQRINKNNK
ncbi:MAG: endolytic transglycosylase MltG [Nitrosomonadales bacterium]